MQIYIAKTEEEITNVPENQLGDVQAETQIILANIDKYQLLQTEIKDVIDENDILEKQAKIDNVEHYLTDQDVDIEKLTCHRELENVKLKLIQLRQEFPMITANMKNHKAIQNDRSRIFNWALLLSEYGEILVYYNDLQKYKTDLKIDPLLQSQIPLHVKVGALKDILQELGITWHKLDDISEQVLKAKQKTLSKLFHDREAVLQLRIQNSKASDVYTVKQLIGFIGQCCKNILGLEFKAKTNAKGNRIRVTGTGGKRYYQYQLVPKQIDDIDIRDIARNCTITQKIIDKYTRVKFTKDEKYKLQVQQERLGPKRFEGFRNKKARIQSVY
jgi:hypothetical protein